MGQKVWGIVFESSEWGVFRTTAERCKEGGRPYICVEKRAYRTSRGVFTGVPLSCKRAGNRPL
jgi:hypothetical protein